MRRSHHGRRGLSLFPCPKCQTPIPAHTACPNCGTYKGREVIDVLKKLSKQEQKQKEKEKAKKGSA
jgi:large subunit ribosomal protein L32